MGISTKVAKRIIQHADLTHCSNVGRPGEMVARSREHPDYAVPYYVDADGVPVVITVVFNTTEVYDRAGATFVARRNRKPSTPRRLAS